MDQNKVKVVVIGAGIAGLSAASHLYEAGITGVIILEASNRIGGRINTINIGSSPYPIELGANWIHGATKDNSVFAIAESSGLLSPYRILTRMSAKFLTEDGKEIDRSIVSKAWNIFQKVYHDGCENEANLEISLVPVLQNILSRTDSRIRHDMHCVFQCLLNYVRFHEGNELSNITMKDTLPDVPGGDLHIPGGYKQVLDNIKRNIPESAILYNSEVVTVKWNDPNAGGMVGVTTRDGRKFEAHHVIVTCSLGYLKLHEGTLFEPALPSRKHNAIASLGFGTVNKIFLEFDRPIFDSSSPGIAFAWENANEKVNSTNWFKRLFGFDAVFTNFKVVVGWISGDGAVAMEDLTDHEIKETSMKLLKKFMRNNSIPNPINFLVTRWQKNPYTLGSYSHRTPHLTKDEYEVMAEPVRIKDGVPVLLFAGEATQRAFYGCTHAARDSGIREAERIIQHCGSERMGAFSKL